MITAYAVGGVHDRVSFPQFAYVADDGFNVGCAIVASATDNRFGVVEFGLGDDDQAGFFKHEAARKGPYGNGKRL